VLIKIGVIAIFGIPALAVRTLNLLNATALFIRRFRRSAWIGAAASSFWTCRITR
jgi:hypothetical protein